jgi:hypothetical protein
MRLGARAGFKRNERMLSLDPRYVIAFPGNGVLERLVIEAKTRRITVVDRRGPLGTSPEGFGQAPTEAPAIAPAPIGAGVAHQRRGARLSFGASECRRWPHIHRRHSMIDIEA